MNGNISDLKRNGYVDSPVPCEIDKLVYSYKTDTNRLTSVTDYSNSTDGFKDGSQVPDDYGYDSNGNMTSDRNKNITSIKYNHLNLPLSIHFSGPTNQGRIFYTYNAIGVKVSKFIDDELAQIQTKTEYLSGGFQYKNSQLEFFSTPEGYVNVTNGKYYNYVYNYTDHLGNMRLSYTFDKQTQSLAVLQENHYYPFGMKHTNYGVSKVEFKEDETGVFALLDPVIRNNYQYKYNGKEYQDELNLNLYDYGARSYDPALDRWMNIDPLAETSRKFSPYTYALNNPIRFIDPDGMEADDVIITGNQSQKAFSDLQNSVKNELSLTMNADGKVTATQIGNDKLSQGATDLLAAASDQSVTVNVNATDEVNTSDGISLRTGNFMGATYNQDGTATTKQEVQPDLLSKLDGANNKTVGQSVLHEITESFKAGKIVQAEKTSVGPATMHDLQNPNSVYSRAHNGVTPASGNLYIQPANPKDGYPQQINFYSGPNNSVLFYQYNFKF